MYLMDCKALIDLATMIGRAEAAAVLQARFDTVNAAMLGRLWNESAASFQNKASADLAPIERMAPTHFYPLLAGPARGPSERQAKATIVRHLTNPARFAVWPSGAPPSDHPVPPEGARPLVQGAPLGRGRVVPRVREEGVAAAELHLESLLVEAAVAVAGNCPRHAPCHAPCHAPRNARTRGR